MTRKLVLIGAGEMAEIADEYFTHDSDYKVVAFSVERDYIRQPELNGKPVVAYEELETLYPPSEYTVFVAIPSSQLNALRTRFYLDAKKKATASPLTSARARSCGATRWSAKTRSSSRTT